jgi:hypothetical protein
LATCRWHRQEQIELYGSNGFGAVAILMIGLLAID